MKLCLCPDSTRHYVPGPEAQFNREVPASMVAFAYLPAMIVVLRRPNTQPSGDGLALAA